MQWPPGNGKETLQRFQNMTTTTNILITGCKSGIGLGLLKQYAARPNTRIIAAIRDKPDSENAIAMVSAASPAQGSKIIPVQYDANNFNAAEEVIQSLKASHPQLEHLDIIVANAGIAGTWGKVHEITAESTQNVFNVNALAPALLFKATRNLLLASPNPKFFAISSSVGSIAFAGEEGLFMTEYGMSKAALNYFTVKANAEEAKITVIPVHPGLVSTSMGDPVADRLGMGEAPTSVDDCVHTLLKLFDTATKEIGGTFQNASGDQRQIPW